MFSVVKQLNLDTVKVLAYNYKYPLDQRRKPKKAMAEDGEIKAEELTQSADENVSAVEEVDNDAKQSKKSKAAKSDASQVQITWRSKEKEKPLVLDKHKVILWVLVGFAVLGLVLAIIPFVVN